MRKVQKNKVVNVEEIEENLRGVSPKLADSFVETCKKINNPKLVKDFWNTLVEYRRHDKEDLADAMMFGAGSTAFTSSLISLNNMQNACMSLAMDIVALGFLTKSAFDLTKASKLNDYDKAINAMQIVEPELYDVALVYNGWTREEIDTSEYDGKKYYQDLHEKMEKKLEEKKAKEQDEMAL